MCRKPTKAQSFCKETPRKKKKHKHTTPKSVRYRLKRATNATPARCPQECALSSAVFDVTPPLAVCLLLAVHVCLLFVRTGPRESLFLFVLRLAHHTHTHLCLLFWRSKTRCRVIAPAEDAVRKLRYVCDGQNRNRSPPLPPPPALRGHHHIEQHAYL